MERAYHIEYMTNGSRRVIIEDGLNLAAVQDLFNSRDILVLALWLLF